MRTFHKITSVFLIAVLLVSSLGFTVNKMVCLKSGKTKISITHVKECCASKKNAQPILKSSCCDLKNTSFDLDDFSISQKHNAPAAATIPLIFGQNNNVRIIRSNNRSELFFADLPPPKSGRQILSCISILII